MRPRSQARQLFPVALFSFVLSMGAVQSCQSRVGVPFDHDAHFSIEGRHVGQPCDGCHAAGFVDTPATCEGCHEAERPVPHYDGSCGDATCHTPFGWDQTGPGDDVPLHPCELNHDDCLPLIGAHDALCATCHGFDHDAYKGLQADCTSCHEAERPVVPEHYPGQDCAPCHQPTAWVDGVEHPIDYEHKAPPAYVKNAECADCHPGALLEYQTFTCVACHAHNQADMDALPIHGANGAAYQYDSAYCYDCHRDRLP